MVTKCNAISLVPHPKLRRRKISRPDGAVFKVRLSPQRGLLADHTILGARKVLARVEASLPSALCVKVTTPRGRPYDGGVTSRNCKLPCVGRSVRSLVRVGFQ